MIYPAIITALLLGQNRDTLIGPGDWLAKHPLKTVSKEWLSISDAVSNSLSYLGKDTKSNRLKKIWQIQSQSPTDENTYKASRYVIEFSEEIKSDKMLFQKLRVFVLKSPGNRDPEFQRAHYIALSTHLSGGVWQGKGKRLIDIFPNDPDLQEAFCYDCRRNMTSVEDKKLGLKILGKIRKKVGERLFYSHYGAINRSLYYATKNDTYRKEAIAGYENFVKHNSDPYYDEIAKEILDGLRKEIG